MQKIIIDTNIFISALIQESFPHFIVYEIVFNNLVLVCLSDEILNEYHIVAAREKFTKYPVFHQKAENLFFKIKSEALYFKLDDIPSILKDTFDNHYLALAKISNADFIITGNVNDFKIDDYFSTKIVTPRAYWENFKPI